MLPIAEFAMSRALYPLDFGADQALDEGGQIVVKPDFQNRSKHFAHHIFQRPRVVKQDSLRESIEGRKHYVVDFR
jgi:hypothetical protein